MSTSAIAVIGIGCRFGTADSPAHLWEVLCAGRDMVGEIPPERFDVDAIYDPTPGLPGKIVTRRGAYLRDVDCFDAAFFSISPREAVSMDPQQRLLLEVAWQALEDAGEDAKPLTGAPAGVFVGMCYNDYEDLQTRLLSDLDAYTNTGGARSVAAGRVASALGLQGPTVVVDAACASSLLAVHLACQSLRAGECELALAAGVNLILHPDFTIGFSRSNMISPAGSCRFGDASADGFVRSEGIGVVVLKPLERALEDGDLIRAVIRGSATNNDGRSGGGLMTPGREGQEAVLRAAYRAAGVSPGTVQYVEAHGTGTRAGDPVELGALGAVVGRGRPPDAPCLVGSVKTNLGHTEGAAGIAGLIKTVLCLEHRAIPPSLHLVTPNPEIPWDDLGVEVVREMQPWPACDGLARAGTSSFGINGSNAHVVLETAPQEPAPPTRTGTGPRRARLLPLSARSPGALRRLAGAHRARAAGEAGAAPELSDLCYTLARHRAHHEYRLPLVAHDLPELAARLAEHAGDDAPEPRPARAGGRERPRVAFLFPGQGSQWLGMGRELLAEEPVFRDMIVCCDRAMRAHADWSLLGELGAAPENSRLDRVDVIQPAIFAMQVGIAELLRSWGVAADAVVGHSLGEVAAAYVAGALSLDDAARVICRRSRIVRRVSEAGGMAVVGLSFEAARDVVAGREDRLAVAAANGPGTSILSGEPEALDDVLAGLEREGVFCRRIKVDYASHSPQMDALLDPLRGELAPIEPRAAAVTFASTVLGRHCEGTELDADYWAANLRRPVLFWNAVAELLEAGFEGFIEISPHPVLASVIRDGIERSGREAVVAATLHRDEPERARLLASVGALYAHGLPVDWDRLDGGEGRRIRLPVYPFERDRYWLEPRGNEARGRSRRLVRDAGGREVPAHPMLSRHMESAVEAGTHHFELDPAAFPYLRDHRVGDGVVLPAAAYAELALAAAAEVSGGDATPRLEAFDFHTALAIPPDGVRILQVGLRPEGADRWNVRFASRAEDESAWTEHAAGVVELDPRRAAASDPDAAAPALPDTETIRARGGAAVPAEEHYAALGARGLDYGPAFRGVVELWRRDGEAVARLRLPDAVAWSAGAHCVHPALLDACFQVLASAVLERAGRAEETWLPVGFDVLRVHGAPGAGGWAHGTLRSPESEETLAGDVALFDDAGRAILEARGLRLRRLPRGAERRLDDALYEIAWQPRAARPAERTDAPDAPDAPDAGGTWILFADRGGVAAELRALLEARAARCVLVTPNESFKTLDDSHVQLAPGSPADFDRLLDEAIGDGATLRGILYLWGLDAGCAEDASPEAWDAARWATCEGALHLVQALARAGVPGGPRLWIVTRGAQAAGPPGDGVSAIQAALVGLGRVIAQEHRELRCARVDLAPDGDPGEAGELFAELLLDGPEDEVALRAGTRLVRRLVRASWTPEEDDASPRPPEPGASYRVAIDEPGVLERLLLRETPRRAPGPGEVEVEIRAVGCNFRDVLLALGLLSPVWGGDVELGWECAGEITAVGEGVEGLREGDAVFGNPGGCMAAYVTVPAMLVVPKPPHLGFEEAAALPIAFETAHYALDHLARLRAGERVLIHTATGGVGLAAIQVARHAGAELFATAGSEAKRALLRELGVEHVYDSRSLRFADQIREATRGEGIDVVLNTLSGAAVAKGLSLLRTRGRFVELGKTDVRDAARLNLQLLDRSISFFAVDMAQLLADAPAFRAEMLREALDLFERAGMKSLPHRVFPVSRSGDALRELAAARHTGKLVVNFDDPEARVVPAPRRTSELHGDASYLITGGLGGLGLSVAAWMAERGARHLVLVSRRGARGEAREAVEALRAQGVDVRVAAADAADRAALARVLDEDVRGMPPLRGVVHAAGLLDDATLLRLDPGRFDAVMAPKAVGAWNLHELTRDRRLDFFVLFSSAASVLGSPGQANYSAANAFLDALAHHRRARALPAQSINWGPWSEVGLAAAQANRGDRLAQRGLASITPAEGVEALGRLLDRGTIQACVMPFDLAGWSELAPGAAEAPLFEALEGAGAASEGAPRLRDELLALESGPARLTHLRDHLRELLARVLHCPASRVDERKSFGDLGLDSLMGVELRNRLESSLELTLPATLIWNYPTVETLAAHLAQRMGVAPDAEPESAERVPQAEEDPAIADVLRAALSTTETD